MSTKNYDDLLLLSVSLFKFHLLIIFYFTFYVFSATNFLGSRGFNEQLDDKNRRFTYFVPRDYAWQKLELEYPSTYKKLFMRDFAYHVS